MKKLYIYTSTVVCALSIITAVRGATIQGGGSSVFQGRSLPAAPVFDPLSLDPWILNDSLESSSFEWNESGKVSRWKDLSGNSRDYLEPVEGEKPIYDAVNHELVFDGVNDSMTTARIPILNAPFTSISVFKIISEPSTPKFIFRDGHGDSPITQYLIRPQRISVIGLLSKPRFYHPAPSGRYYIVMVFFDGGADGKVYINGELVDENHDFGAVQLNNRLTIGSNNDGDNSWLNVAFKFKSFIPGLITADQANKLGSYLVKRFSLPIVLTTIL